MFIKATPGYKLLKIMRETEDKYRISNDQRIKIVSKAGSKLVNLVERKDPFQTKCEMNKCPVCDNSDKLVTNCVANNVCYEANVKFVNIKVDISTTLEKQQEIYTREAKNTLKV